MVKLMQVREVSHEAGKVVTVARAESLDKPLEWAVGFFFGNAELSLGFLTVIAGTPLVPLGQAVLVGWKGCELNNPPTISYIQQVVYPGLKWKIPRVDITLVMG